MASLEDRESAKYDNDARKINFSTISKEMQKWQRNVIGLGFMLTKSENRKVNCLKCSL